MSRKGQKKKSQRNDKQRPERILFPTMSVSDQQKLPAKFQNIFDKQVLSEYESDNYRECIKHCDRILVLYPKHGETNAMKGLCLHCQGSKKEDDDDEDAKRDSFQADREEKDAKLRAEGLQLIQMGLRCNLKTSSIIRSSDFISCAILDTR